MKKTHSYKNITWLDFDSPSSEDARALMESHDVSPLVANELLSPTFRPRVEAHKKSIYLILHFPSFSHDHDGRHTQEIDFIIQKDALITARYGDVPALREFEKRLESDSILGKNSFEATDEEAHGGTLFFHMARQLYRSAREEMDRISARLADVENRIFDGEEHAMVYEISRIGREVLDCKRAFRLHDEMLRSFENAAHELFGDDYTHYVRALRGEYESVASMLASVTETLAELRTTNDSLLTTKTNDIMRVLTIMAFVTFPLMLFTSLFGMNTQFAPVVGQPNDFWIIVGFMVAVTVVFFGYFKYKKWL